ncbi:Protein Smf [Durusdinium trenchii]|uniref:Protein Smf n=1 Tax=Durusdinium trenchii TaxID=1381693 RepID=A0ABP0KR46_9DINO
MESASHEPPRHDLALLQLNHVPGIGPRILSLLLARFGSAEAVFEASGRELLEIQGVGPKLSAAITAARHFDDARKEWRRCGEKDVTLLFRSQSEYPEPLRQIPDPPTVLYVHGTIEPADGVAVGIVGSRHCTAYGRRQAHRLAAGLARAGVTVVSGLARGIDAAAHQGALEAEGRTLAVLATGLFKMYPPEHVDLATSIRDRGAVVTESPLDRGPLPGLFPQRNRIISGLSRGVIIVEAGRRSGALHTARHAMEQGREVFAVPGRIDSRASEGCHDLLRDGATLVRGVDDVLEALGPLSEPVASEDGTVLLSPRELGLNPQEQEVLQLIGLQPTPIDQVLATTALDSSRALATITVLEMKRLVQRHPGGFIERIAR